VREVKRPEALRQRSLRMDVLNSSKDRAMFVRKSQISLRNSIANPSAIPSHRAVNFSTQDFDYHLPEERIASRPLADRASSRMMVVHRESGTIEHRMFRDILEYLDADDLLVLNDTKVIPARLFSNDGKSELLCLDRSSPTLWRCLVKPGKKMREIGRASCRERVYTSV
jgi:hypothetical protein